MPDQGLLVFVSGPSGVGKSTVCRRLEKELPAYFAVSATTRIGKTQDTQGKRYEFVNETEFQRLIESKAFLEYAVVFGNMYGTLRKPVTDALDASRYALLEIDVQGAIQVHQMFPNAMGVFILPPSEDDLLKRLRERGRDDEATILRRFTEAKQEIRTARNCGAYDLFVVNYDHGVDRTVEEVTRAIKEYRKGL